MKTQLIIWNSTLTDAEVARHPAFPIALIMTANSQHLKQARTRGSNPSASRRYVFIVGVQRARPADCNRFLFVSLSSGRVNTGWRLLSNHEARSALVSCSFLVPVSRCGETRVFRAKLPGKPWTRVRGAG